MMYYYQLFGLTIASKIECPELLSNNTPEQAQVTIRFGDLTHVALPQDHIYRHTLVDSNHLLIAIEGIGKYLIGHGKEIIIDPVPSVTEAEIRLFLLGSAMGAILHQRSLLPIHANAVIINNKAVIIAGHSGKGKSTLAAAFAHKGLPLLCDDICTIDLSNPMQPLALPGHPHIKLWSDAMKHFKLPPEQYRQISPAYDKYFFPITTAKSQKAYPINALYALHFHQDKHIHFHPLNKKQSMIVLKNNTYRKQIAQSLNKKRHFSLCGQLAQHHALTHIVRPKDFELIEPLVDRIIEQNSMQLPT